MAYLRMWRKRKADINELLQSDSDDNPVMTKDDSDLTLPTSSDGGGCNADDNNTSDVLDFDMDIEMSKSDVELLNLEPDLEVKNLGDDLREWNTTHHTTHRSLNELFRILREHGHVLPKDAHITSHSTSH